ncbi:unnamed protein product [Citrullus colocynthis]|uniref:Uncharacterized protein n=1 Tax=Citrullus colocynthis TaxID=252529 RepID=A0ABP0Y2X6_9ROSI
MESQNPLFVFFLLIIISLLALNLPSIFAAHYIHPSPPSLSPLPPPTTKPLVPYYPFIIPPPPTKKTYKFKSPPSPSSPLQGLGRPVVPYYPFKFPPPPSRKRPNSPPSYHVFPPPASPLPVKKLYTSQTRRSAPPPPPKKPYQWPKRTIRKSPHLHFRKP